MFYMVCIPTKIPHSKVPPWVTIERDLKINLEDCQSIGDNVLEIQPNFIDLQEAFKQYSQHKRDKVKEEYEPEKEQLSLKRYDEDPNELPLKNIVDQMYVYNQEGQKSIKQLYKAYSVMSTEINLAHHDVLQQYFMKEKRNISVACAIDEIKNDKAFLETIFGDTDKQLRENKNKMLMTNFFYDLTYVLGEPDKKISEQEPIDVMKNMYFITQASKKIFEFIGYISGQKNFCEYIINNSSEPIEIEQFEDISALEDMFDARLIHYQRKIDQYLENLKNEKGVFEDINYSGIFVSRKAQNQAEEDQDLPLFTENQEGSEFMHKQVQKLSDDNLSETFKTFGDMDMSGLPAEDVSDALEAIEIIQEDFPRYINQLEKNEIIKRKEQAYLRIIPLLKSIHAYGRILEVKDVNNLETKKLTKGEFRELRESKQKFLHLMHNIQQKTGKNQQKFLSGLVDDLVHMERLSKQRELAMNRKLQKKQRKLFDTKCDPYFFRLHPLIIKNWTPAMIEIKQDFVNMEKEEQTPEKLYDNIQLSPLVFPESLNQVDFNAGFGESEFTKFLETFTGSYDMQQHKFYFITKYFHDFFEALIVEYAVDTMDFYDCYQKVKFFSYEAFCPLEAIFQKIATEVDFSKLTQLVTNNFLEDGEELYKEMEKFIHYLDISIKEEYEKLKDEKNKVDKDVQIEQPVNQGESQTQEQTNGKTKIIVDDSELQNKKKLLKRKLALQII